MDAQEKKDDVIDALDDLFGDTTVTKEQTLEYLEEIQSELESKIDALKADIRNEREAGIE
jgi:hypothetical protein